MDHRQVITSKKDKKMALTNGLSTLWEEGKIIYIIIQLVFAWELLVGI